ncbi:MAG: ABC transporter substrate-binding protein, partial [Oscillospiraceae bacterium]|nr:ABC transporter substrate-binding protein [Oscillospiraceae bacterium]
LCLAMVFSLAACGSGSSVTTTTTAAATEAPAAAEDEAAEPADTTKSGDLTPVTIQLKWVQQAQFMGYYAAKELGIYEDFGLDVTIIPGGSVDVIDEVDSGRADFGVTWVSTAMSSIANGSNVMIVAQYYQDSGMTLVSLDGTVADPTVVSEGEVTGNWGGGNEYEMQAYLASLGLSTDYVTEDYDMQQLFDGDITWSSAMTYNEMGLVLEAGYTMDDINVLYMEGEGFGMLEDCLIVDTGWAEENEDTVTAFIAASSLGWAWCLENPTAAGSLVFNAEDTANTVSEYHQQFEASEVAKLVASDITTVGERDSYTLIGYMDADKFQQTYDIFSQYVDISNITAESAYTAYFYDLAVADEQFLSALENFDSYVWDGTFEVLYEG